VNGYATVWYGYDTWMKTALEIVCDGVASGNTRLMLIGAYAMQAYDVVRQTMDLDCLVVDEQEASLGAVLRDVGYVERQRTDAFIRYSHRLRYTEQRRRLATQLSRQPGATRFRIGLAPSANVP